LSAGNTVAVKMPGQTALVANLVSQVIAEVTSLPRGVVNIFTESGNTGARTWSPRPMSRSSATPAALRSGASSPRTAPPPSSG
jgi:acyl-CoA reductase-like NAD-dependent aldehyde dehydrogenase